MPAAIRRVLLCVFLLVAGVAQAQTSFTSIVVFGDSLSDTGNIANLVQNANPLKIRYPADNQIFGFNYTDGRFTDGKDTQPAAQAYQGVWVEQLAASLPAAPPVKNALDGGTNYAYGDATTGGGTTTETQTVNGITVSIALHNMGQQVADYLANVASKSASAPNSQTLYVLWGGANDLYQASAAGADLSAATQTAITNELTLVAQLASAGATNFMIPNLPPLGGVPNYAANANANALNAAAAGFAQGLTQGITALKSNLAAQSITITVYQPDIFGLFGQFATNPTSVGLGDIADKAQGISGSPDTYLIWDGLHPTTTGHHYAAATAANLLTPLVSSTTTLTVPSAVVGGQTVTLTANVTGSTGHVPSGLVTFFNGATAVGSATLSATGVGTTTIVPFATSNYNLTAVYAGDTTDKISASAAQPLAAIPTAVATTTALTSSSGSVTPGASVTLTATVTPALTTFGPATGTVTFLNGTTTLGTGTLSNGVATYTTTALPAGSLSLTATYAASGVFAGSASAALTEVVAAPSFTATLTPTSLTITSGASGMTTLTSTSINFTGTLTPSCGTLPAHMSCTFAVISTANSVLQAGQEVWNLTIATNAMTTAALRTSERPGAWRASPVLSASILLAGTLFLGFRRRLRLSGGLWAGVLVLLSSAALLGLSGCGASASNNTPTGAYTIPVIVTPAAGSSVAAQTVNLSVTVQ